MYKKTLLILFFQTLAAGLTYGQSLTYSKKISFQQETYFAATLKDDLTCYQTYDPATKSATTLALGPTPYFSMVSYNPLPFDLDENNAVSVYSAFMLSRFIESNCNHNLYIFNKRDQEKPLSDANFETRIIRGRHTPLAHLIFDAEGREDPGLFFDLARASKDELRFYTYTKVAKKLEVWTCDTRQDIQLKNQEIRFNEYKDYWKLKHTISMDLLAPFTAFVHNGKDYVITEDGTLYCIEQELTALKKLPAALSSSIVLLDRDKNEVYYVPNCLKSKTPPSLKKIVAKKRINLNLE